MRKTVKSVVANIKLLMGDYLVSDLQSMLTISPDGFGNCNYPILISTLAGMNLLGGILPPKIEKTRIGHYWDNYLSKVRPQSYGHKHLEIILDTWGWLSTQFNGSGLLVYKKRDDPHMCMQNGLMAINSTLFAEDFIKSYRELVEPLLELPPDSKDSEYIKRRIHKLYFPRKKK